jgi:hypothetical protein
MHNRLAYNWSDCHGGKSNSPVLGSNMAQKAAIVTETFCDFLQSIQENAGTLDYLKL